MNYENTLIRFVDRMKEILKENLTGIYLHGSLAMGCFNPGKSDIDLIAVTEESISDLHKMRIMRHIVRLNEEAPPKGLEISFVLRKWCNPFVYPTPFELHFSPIHLKSFYNHPVDYIEKMKGVDIDLAAHFSIINRFGVVLYGESIDRVFAEVPEEYYRKSICADVENAVNDITENPIYMTLNLCRILAFMKNGLYLSKEQGGKWGLDFLPEYRTVISEALECYMSDRNMKVNSEELRLFAKETLHLINLPQGDSIDD